MSNLWCETYDYAIAPTLSDTVDEPIAFSGLYIATTGNVVLWNRNGPQSANPISFAATTGTYIRWPIRRVGSTNTTATVFGLVSGIVR